MGEQFEQFDPLSRRFAPSVPRPKGGLVNVFDEEAERFGSLTGVDRATAAIHLRAATLRGASFEEAVDRFYQNNGAHVRDENANADEAAVERQKTRKELDQSDSALARALAEEDRESKGLSHAFDDVVAQLEDMGFDKALALRAVEAEKDLEKATNFCLRGEKTTTTEERTSALSLQQQQHQHQHHHRGSSHSTSSSTTTTTTRRQGQQQQQQQRLGGFDEEARMAAMRVQKVGRLYKLSSSKAVLGQRWQSRSFQLKNGVLSYTTGSGGPPSKTINLWQCYALKTKKIGGTGSSKNHCFAVYAESSEFNATTLGGSGQYQKLRLAADDEKTLAEWILAIYHAAGRPKGCVVKVGANELKCGCNFPSNALDIDERGVIVALDADGASAGLRVGDAIQTVNEDSVHSINAARAMVARVKRPFEMTVVRLPNHQQWSSRQESSAESRPADNNPAQTTTTTTTTSRRGPSSSSAGMTKKSPPPPVIDLLSLEELPDAEEVFFGAAQSPEEDDLAAVRTAQTQVARAETLARAGQSEAARVEARRAVETLLNFQPLYAEKAALRDAVAREFPAVGLAVLYDRAVAIASNSDEEGPAAKDEPTPPQHHHQIPQLPPVPPRQRTVTAAFDFEATESWQLSVAQGDDLDLVDFLDDGWADVVSKDLQRGLVPSSYVTEHHHHNI